MGISIIVKVNRANSFCVQCYSQEIRPLPMVIDMTNKINFSKLNKIASSAIRHFFKYTAPAYQEAMLEELKQDIIAEGVYPEADAAYIYRVAKQRAHRLTGNYQSYINCKNSIRRWVAEQKLLKLKDGKFSCNLHPKSEGTLVPTASLYDILAQIESQSDSWFTFDQIVTAYQYFAVKKVPLEASDIEGYCKEDPENFTVVLPQLNSATKKWQHKKSDPAFEKMLVAFCELACTSNEVDDIILMRHALLKDDAGGIMNFACRLQEELGTGSVKRTTMSYRLQSLHEDLQAQLSGWNLPTQRAMIRDFIDQVRKWYIKVTSNLGC